MTDIVERLRNPYEWRVVNKRYDDPDYNEAPIDAADEIERLREENKKLRKTVEYYAIESNWEYWLKNQSIANIRAWQTLQELNDD